MANLMAAPTSVAFVHLAMTAGRRLMLTYDNGELEVPYAGLIPASGRTCKQIAYAVKAALEKEYYYNATVIIAVEVVNKKDLNLLCHRISFHR